MGVLYVAPAHGQMTYEVAAMGIARRTLDIATRHGANTIVVFADAKRPAEKAFTGMR